jgi:hypothetical protein
MMRTRIERSTVRRRRVVTQGHAEGADQHYWLWRLGPNTLSTIHSLASSAPRPS